LVPQTLLEVQEKSGVAAAYYHSEAGQTKNVPTERSRQMVTVPTEKLTAAEKIILTLAEYEYLTPYR
jgi:hypothetical protein